jgi:hypothetical protein
VHGGVVRDSGTHRIVAHLRDADASSADLVAANVVPLAILGISAMAQNHRLKKIDAEIRKLSALMEDVAASAKLANVKLDGQLMGRLLGALHACHLELASGDTQRFAEYRQVFLEAYYQFRLTVDAIVRDPDLLRRHDACLRNYAQAMFLAGVAARDTSYRMTDHAGALHIADEVAKHSVALAAHARDRITAPSALFWRNDAHVELVLEVRESAARLTSHEETLRVLPRAAIDELGSRQLDM